MIRPDWPEVVLFIQMPLGCFVVAPCVLTIAGFSWNGPPPASVDISAKELLPIVAAAVWGQSWAGHRYSDNTAVVAVIQRRSARDHVLLHLLRCLYFYAAHYQFIYQAGIYLGLIMLIDVVVVD